MIEELKSSLKEKSFEEGLRFVANQYPGKVVFSSAFGQEDQAIAHAIFKNDIDVKVFTLDTGRLFKETYELIDQTRSRYKKPISVYYPNTANVEQLVTEKGMHSFYNSVASRKECCFVRKVEPLKRALEGASVWITGLRSGQSVNREEFEQVEWDEQNKVIKYNPILDWTYDQLLDYLKENNVPYNKLHDQGFISIGCAPCTRAITAGEDSRAGRWWWETSQKECGLHQLKTA
ncbi:phosphoadenylyl-sulfate reductase [Roseivirga misakiensis]|uniref:Adenosine 5'-phosphosulfate reductase n=1 Tax=Roseivirga misakiensis TaxID=1563681 RepID=A0A1E5SK73_9BACT|nr:phosphoadenylyl-sulfate reductase [Roseivirga misakiensis]OEJ99522.1 phosphoadenosine phosphosulfate reductase [Roseivirga misakiensis]